MNPLANFLEKFAVLLSKSRDVKKSFLVSLKSKANITLAENEIDVKDNIVYIKSHPAVRMEIFMRKKAILDELRLVLDTRTPRDIR